MAGAHLKYRLCRGPFVISLDWKRSVSDFSICYAIVGGEDLNEKFDSCRRFSVI